MAPKPPPAKGPGADPGKKPPRTPTKIEEILSGYNCATVGILMLFSLFLYTLWFISLCTVEKAKKDPLRNAVAQIRNYLISLNATYGDLNDTDLILAAEKVSRSLLTWAQKINEIQAEIADLHYKLNHDWTAHKGFLYLFSMKSESYYLTVQTCNQSKAHIVSILDDYEEEFIEKMIFNAHGSYWIGYRYVDKVWRMEIDITGRPEKYYWADGEPSSYNDCCVRLKSGCNEKLKCWISAPCSMYGRGICKQRPEEKWIN